MSLTKCESGRETAKISKLTENCARFSNFKLSEYSLKVPKKSLALTSEVYIKRKEMLLREFCTGVRNKTIFLRLELKIHLSQTLTF